LNSQPNNALFVFNDKFFNPMEESTNSTLPNALFWS
jgi:hypothetical protein